MLNPIRCLTFSGGGIKGLSYVGCLRSLEEHGIIPHITCLVGTSAGSIFATCINVGYTSTELRDIVMNLDFNEMRDITSANVLNYFSSFGFDTGNRVERIIRILIKKKIGTDAITFQQLYQKTQQQLIITGTCLNTREIVNFTHTSHPDMEVIQAIRISMSVPFVFNVCHYQDDMYVDGGVGSNYSVDAYHPYQDVLGFLLQEERGHKEIHGLEDYAVAIIRTIDRRLNDLYMMMYPDISVKIQSAVDMLDFNIQPEAVQQLVQDGYLATNQYLESFPARKNYSTSDQYLEDTANPSSEPPSPISSVSTNDSGADNSSPNLLDTSQVDTEATKLTSATTLIQEVLETIITNIQENQRKLNPLLN